MKAFNFEKDLLHQKQAVESATAVFENIEMIYPPETDKKYINPVFDYLNDRQYAQNLSKIQKENGLKEPIKRNSHIIDIMMETGTGKTYTYTKTIYEINKLYGIFKFIVVVPTLSIKAGTIDFLKSDSCREHFKEQYNKTIKLHIVESQKNNKSKKSYIPTSISSFVTAENHDKKTIQVMIINAGMINSDTMQKSFDKSLFDKYSIPFDAIAAVKPFTIIDEPHKYAKDKKTWENIKKMNSQFILRYGATFQEYENIVYSLSAVDSFNRNLVKGVIGHITEFDAGKNALVRFVDSDGTEAFFELIENNERKRVTLVKNESFNKVHSVMTDLTLEKLNKSIAVLSNGLEMRKGEKINPYSYAETLQEIMIQKTIKNHFEIERKLLKREVKIKPLTLFFIDNIEEYRNMDGYIRKTLEKYVGAEVSELLKTETDPNYKSLLEKTYKNISGTHAGYFSQDNEEKDETIEKELNEILHDKQAILDLENPRRFIFSKWTLREGWDNPNVFQICKLRSSGSEISKLQEVGRGLRLPVNEYGNRVKDEQFYLNYYVDFTESDFIEKLVEEINQKSGIVAAEQEPEKISEEMIEKICEIYEIKEDDLIDDLIRKNIIKPTHRFIDGGFAYIKNNYPRVFDGVNANKIRKATDNRKKVKVRSEKYLELKELWETLSEKAILEYKFENENAFKNLLTEFLEGQKSLLTNDGIRERVEQIVVQENNAFVQDSESVYSKSTKKISTMKYSDLLKELSKLLNINLKTIHQAIIDSKIGINEYLNSTTVRILKQNFDDYLMKNAIDKFSIEYKRVSNNIHPTKLTDAEGNVLQEISSSDVGVFFSNEAVNQKYLYEELYFDSELEKKNIMTEIDEVIVFTKIPKNSIKIPVAGGKSYSPDFAYVLKYKDGEKKLHFIIETKNVDNEIGLRTEEISKIRHAEEFFKGRVKIEFRTQFSNTRMADLISEVFNKNPID
ncbi:MAG: type III restriction-modification system endonuclease [bacterium]